MFSHSRDYKYIYSYTEEAQAQNYKRHKIYSTSVSFSFYSLKLAVYSCRDLLLNIRIYLDFFDKMPIFLILFSSFLSLLLIWILAFLFNLWVFVENKKKINLLMLTFFYNFFYKLCVCRRIRVQVWEENCGFQGSLWFVMFTAVVHN